jgi:hypothetical protein
MTICTKFLYSLYCHFVPISLIVCVVILSSLHIGTYFHLGGRASIGRPRVDSARSAAVTAATSVEATASVVAAVAAATAAAETPRGVAVAGGLAALLAGLGRRRGCASGLLREVPLDQSLPFDSSLVIRDNINFSGSHFPHSCIYFS